MGQAGSLIDRHCARSGAGVCANFSGYIGRVDRGGGIVLRGQGKERGLILCDFLRWESRSLPKILSWTGPCEAAALNLSPSTLLGLYHSARRLCWRSAPNPSATIAHASRYSVTNQPLSPAWLRQSPVSTFAIAFCSYSHPSLLLLSTLVLPLLQSLASAARLPATVLRQLQRRNGAG